MIIYYCSLVALWNNFFQTVSAFVSSLLFPKTISPKTKDIYGKCLLKNKLSSSSVFPSFNRIVSCSLFTNPKYSKTLSTLFCWFHSSESNLITICELSKMLSTVRSYLNASLSYIKSQSKTKTCTVSSLFKLDFRVRITGSFEMDIP